MGKLDNRNQTIRCDACTDIAKATLEGRHLCAGCLMRELMSARDSSLFDRLTPLPDELNAQKSSESKSQPPN